MFTFEHKVSGGADENTNVEVAIVEGQQTLTINTNDDIRSLIQVLNQDL